MTVRSFYDKTREACDDRELSRKLHTATDRQDQARKVICEELGDIEAFRELAKDLRDDILWNLDRYLTTFVEHAETAGVRVHWAADAGEAREAIAGIAEKHNVQRIVKSKSMVTEEIGLNDHLERHGYEVIETDLGEFIVQLKEEGPSHIVVPAVHLSTADVGMLFKEKLGYTGPIEADALTKAARRHLREIFKTAQMGISGVNLAVAEQGQWIICTNEGNGRFVTTMPQVYVAVMGMERIVQDIDSAGVILKLLAKFATGQRLTQYVNIMQGPGDDEGPRHVHLVILDNGRSRILGSRYRSMLRCIRCGACLNACPVFKQIGGHPYSGCYSGPMGSVLLPLLEGLKQAGDATKACSLCRLCNEVCPVKIPLADHIVALRSDMVKAGITDRLERVSMAAASRILRHPQGYRWGRKFMRSILRLRSHAGWVRDLPSIPGRWTREKDLPLPAPESFIEAFYARQAADHVEADRGE
ncbi:MAG: iron-sulfur cluster-binding protein [Candidatus Eisenbacteria bacterium]|uniref:Iron-sulfur cluster-binding protein n=1 Tax=Eiseniibacteriota bacterium TaxID=2212470 RepID=A0A948W206_UNCEI|nr:iron-sulfur cluster-binding protein [Candidatus Eisenbacteria bacterium]MBU1949781.1 iron-sulfur cluster-binding protein [Candidatus Eisenbacteria bacterium]MBU2689422.1 iron-sulfur cluster-binding protein [Candidatus Eisenbacteria bacterium]